MRGCTFQCPCLLGHCKPQAAANAHISACAHNPCSPLPAFTQHSYILPFPFLVCPQGMDIRGLVYVGREHLKHVMNGCLRMRDMLGRMQAVAPKPQAVKESPFARVCRGRWCEGCWVKLVASLLASRMEEVHCFAVAPVPAPRGAGAGHGTGHMPGASQRAATATGVPAPCIVTLVQGDMCM